MGGPWLADELGVTVAEANPSQSSSHIASAMGTFEDGIELPLEEVIVMDGLAVIGDAPTAKLRARPEIVRILRACIIW